MSLEKEIYYLIEDNNVIQDKVFDIPEDAIEHLNHLAKAHTGVDIRAKDGEVKILAVEVVKSVYPTASLVIELPYGAFV